MVMFLAVSHACYPRGAELPNFGAPCIYFYPLRHRTIEFGGVTYEEVRVLGVSHAIPFLEVIILRTSAS